MCPSSPDGYASTGRRLRREGGQHLALERLDQRGLVGRHAFRRRMRCGRHRTGPAAALPTTSGSTMKLARRAAGRGARPAAGRGSWGWRRRRSSGRRRFPSPGGTGRAPRRRRETRSRPAGAAWSSPNDTRARYWPLRASFRHTVAKRKPMLRVQRLEHRQDHVVDLAVARGAHLGHVLHAGQQQVARIVRLAARVGSRLRRPRRRPWWPAAAHSAGRRCRPASASAPGAAAACSCFAAGRSFRSARWSNSVVQLVGVEVRAPRRSAPAGRALPAWRPGRPLRASRRDTSRLNEATWRIHSPRLAAAFSAPGGSGASARTITSGNLPFGQHGFGQRVVAAAEDHLRGLRQACACRWRSAH